MPRSVLIIVAAVLALGAGGLAAPAVSKPPPKGPKIDHIVVIYEENHSFDNVFGGWEHVNGLDHASAQRQVMPDGSVLPCLPQNDVNLTSPPLPITCSGTVGSQTINSAFANAPFRIDDYIQPEDTTCPPPGVFAPNGVLNGAGLPGGCTRDLVHRFYNEQYQIDGGRQDRYVAGSDAVGLTMGTYDTTELPIYKYLHSADAPHYAIADNFFQSAFGGSFLNHQWLIAAKTPIWPRCGRGPGRQRPALGRRSRRLPRRDPAASRDARHEGRRADPGRQRGWFLQGAGRRAHPARRDGVRRLRREHGPARLPAVRARDGRRPSAAAADRADHRRPTVRRRCRLGVVLRRLVQRQWRRQRPRLDQRHHPRDLHRPGHHCRRRSTRTARTSCSSSTTSRSTTTPTTRRAPPPAPPTCATSRSSSPRRRAVT